MNGEHSPRPSRLPRPSAEGLATTGGDRLVAIVGPTAAGKSALAVQLALKFNGEIVSADSRQVYRYMDIGTAKPSLEERALVPHHMVDIINPNEEFSVALYRAKALAAVEDIHQRGRLPFLVGGSGLYVWTILEGLRVPQVEPNLDLRRELFAVAEEEGGLSRLFEQLREVDPVAAGRMDPRNVRRVVRALEVYRTTGVPFSQLGAKEPPPFKTLIIGLTAPRAELYRRIDARVDKMIEQGLVEEVKSLLAKGYSPELPSMSGLGYAQVCQHLRGEMDLPTAIQKIKHDTHRFVRHQYAWFKLKAPRIQWVDAMGEVVGEAGSSISKALGSI